MNRNFGTHDSLTGYPLRLWWQRLFAPLVLAVSRTQNKPLRLQYDAGCRSFDFRFAKHKGRWYAAHGAALFDITFDQAMGLLDQLPDTVYVRIVAEDTFIECDVLELEGLVKVWFIRHNRTKVQLLCLTSKRDWTYRTSVPTCEDQFVNYDDRPITENDRDSLCAKVARMYELQTSADRFNLIGCYESGGVPIRLFGWQPILFGLPLQVPLPRLAADALTKIALRKQWKDNDVPIVDFL